MANLPCGPHRIGIGIEAPTLKPDFMPQCWNPNCERQASELHHVVRRSHLNGPYEICMIDGLPMLNIMPLCRQCHDKLETNEAIIRMAHREWIWHEGKVSDFIFGDTGLAGGETNRPPEEARVMGETPAPVGSPPASPEPGQKCPTCNRYVRHKRKASSPESAKISFSLPKDDKKLINEYITAAAEAHGFAGEPYFESKAVMFGLVLLLQEVPGG